MSITHQLALPFPPSVNSLFGGGSKQQRFPSKAYKVWLASCPVLEPHGVMQAHVTLCYWFPDARARDIDNHAKAVLDYLVKQNVIVDDCYEHLPRIELLAMGIDRKNPRVDIFVKVMK